MWRRSDRVLLRKLENQFYVEIEDLPVLAPIRAILIDCFEVLTIVTRSFILDVTGFLDLPLEIEKFDLSLCSDPCCVIIKEMLQILNITLSRSLSIEVFSVP